VENVLNSIHQFKATQLGDSAKKYMKLLKDENGGRNVSSKLFILL